MKEDLWKNFCNQLDDIVLKKFNEPVWLDRMVTKNNPYRENNKLWNQDYWNWCISIKEG